MFGLFQSKGKIATNAPDPALPHSLELYTSSMCPYCRRVERVLPELALEIERRDVNTDSTHRRKLIEVTGRSTVPCLFIDGQPMFESLDIIAWLEAHAAAM